MNYYNDVDSCVAAWLRELVADGLIPDGKVDDRSILDVRPSDLEGFAQCHFFAGIGGWPLALKMAGWPEGERVWTGSCPCFPAGTLVFTDHGMESIEKVMVGDMVLTHKGRFRPVTMVGSETSGCVIVKGQGHSGLVCTPNHPFYVLHDGKEEWVEARNLKGKRWTTVRNVPKIKMPPLERDSKGYFFSKWHGKFIARGSERNKPVYLGIFKNEEDAKACVAEAIRTKKINVRGANRAITTSLGFARFLGYWVGDGWVTKNSVILCGNKLDQELLHEIFEGIGFHGAISVERSVAKIRCGSKRLSSWLRFNFGGKAYGKYLPTWLYGMPKKYKREFLRGYFEADGHQETPNAISFSTVSKRLSIGIRILLNQIGRPASIRIINNKRELRIEGRRVNERPYYRILSYDKPRSFKLSRSFGHGLVRSIEYVGSRRVFNLSVKEDESYVADGIIAHNCQPFSVAGKRKGEKDERHLWPEFRRLIEFCKPPILFGEQVASKDGREWMDNVRSDLESFGYDVGVADLCAAAVGAPHMRQRLYFGGRHVDTGGVGGAVAGDLLGSGPRIRLRVEEVEGGVGQVDPGPPGEPHEGQPAGVADAEDGDGRRRKLRDGGMADGDDEGLEGQRGAVDDGREPGRVVAEEDRYAAPGGCPDWNGRCRWHACRDGKYRRIPVQSSLQPLAHGISGRMGLLRGAGNAILPELAARFVKAFVSAAR